MSLKILNLFVDDVEYEDHNLTQLFKEYIIYFRNLNDYKIYKSYPKTLSNLCKCKNNKQLFKIKYFKIFINKKTLTTLMKDKVFIYPIVRVFLEIDFNNFDLYVNYFLSNLDTITSYCMFNTGHYNNTFKIFQKDFNNKFSLNLFEILNYLVKYEEQYEFETLNFISSDSQISSYYKRYNQLDEIYFRGKELEKTEKKVLLQISTPSLVSKY